MAVATDNREMFHVLLLLVDMAKLRGNLVT